LRARCFCGVARVADGAAVARQRLAKGPACLVARLLRVAVVLLEFIIFRWAARLDDFAERFPHQIARRLDITGIVANSRQQPDKVQRRRIFLGSVMGVVNTGLAVQLALIFGLHVWRSRCRPTCHS
jgi:hypothetical protein